MATAYSAFLSFMSACCYARGYPSQPLQQCRIKRTRIALGLFVSTGKGHLDIAKKEGYCRNPYSRLHIWPVLV